VRREKLIFGVARDVTMRKDLEERLRLLADHDGLTGAYNRRTWFELSEKELARSRRHGFPLSVLMVDLDCFKSINDSYGHAAGDEVLRAVPHVFATVLRGHDVVGRIGGEEFAVTLAQCDGETAARIADRLRVGAERTAVAAGELSIRFTLSVGVSSLAAETDTLQSLLERADTALYEAKRGGRNRVVSAKPF
jgi:diguanylate cyclase (GGDEF)-like protein